jgi:hypothetical protein
VFDSSSIRSMSSSAQGPTGIYTPGSIWAKAIEQSKQQKKAEAGREDAHVYFLGARGSGKSTLLSRFLYPTQAEVPKPSQCLEYTFARKPGSSYGAADKKELAHIWEVSGSDAFAQQLSQGEGGCRRTPFMHQIHICMMHIPCSSGLKFAIPAYE